MFELASILGDSIESLLNHLTTQNGTYLSQYSAGQPAFGRLLSPIVHLTYTLTKQPETPL